MSLRVAYVVRSVQMCAHMQGWTPLHHACARGHDTIVGALLMLGANANAESPVVSVYLAYLPIIHT